MPDRVPRLLALDGIRGLAVMMVLLDHASDAGMRLHHTFDLNRAGRYGVYLFFVLSAFLLTWQLAQRAPEDLIKARTWVDYGIRRILRIFPLYTGVVLAYVLMGKLDFHQVDEHLLLREGTGHFWTIPVEVKFYILLPLLAVAFFWAARKHWLAGLGASMIVIAFGWVFTAFDERWSIREEVLLAPNLAPFLFGALLVLLSRFLDRHPGLSARSAWVLEFAGVAALAAILVRIPALHLWLFSEKSPLGKEFDPLLCGALWAVFVLATLHGKGFLSQSLRWKPLRYLGLISFSVYLWHRRFLNDIDDVPLPAPFRLLLFTAIVLAVSVASYFIIERPMARLAARLTRRPAMPLLAEPG